MKSKSSSVDLLVYFLISIFVLTVTGLLYKTLFVVYNYPQFSSLSSNEVAYAIIWGIRFDLASAAFFSLISCTALWLFSRFKPSQDPAALLLAVMLVMQVSLQLSDTMYFAESGRHVSYEMRDALADASGLFMTALTQHTLFIVLSYLLCSVIVLSVMRYLQPLLPKPITILKRLKFNLDVGIKFFIIVLLSVIAVRGGVTGLPQSVISAFKIGDAQQAIISMNGAYSVVYGVLNSSKEVSRVPVSLPEDTDVEKVMRSLYPVFHDMDSTRGETKKYNLIFILMEGWPADLMLSYGYEKQTTPFYDSLKERALSPRGVVAGGVRTTEGVYATFCSQQNPLGETVAQSSLQNNQYQCLPDMLKQQGWHTVFFQGSHKETSGTGAFAQSLGFSESFAIEDMPSGRYERNYWGAHDPDIYDFVLAKLDDMPQPFLIGVNTNSTHDVQVPADAEYFFGEANREQKHLSILYFADQAMQEFFEKIKTKPYYENTVFVLMSDHTLGAHNSNAARYFIPGIIYSENHVPAADVNRYVSQRDFAPTILKILGLPESPSFTGKSFWSKRDDVYFSDYFDSGSIGWINDSLLVETSVENPAVTKCYTIEKGLLNATQVDCSEKHKSESLKSLVFTSYSQDLLFKGKTEKYYGFLEKNNE